MADALASGASVRKDVGVQVPPRAHRMRGPDRRKFDGPGPSSCREPIDEPRASPQAADGREGRYVRSKNLSKNAVSFSMTVCFLAPWFVPFANRETGGRMPVMAVPETRTCP